VVAPEKLQRTQEQGGDQACDDAEDQYFAIAGEIAGEHRRRDS
jgi:hypothetical protein